MAMIPPLRGRRARRRCGMRMSATPVGMTPADKARARRVPSAPLRAGSTALGMTRKRQWLVPEIAKQTSGASEAKAPFIRDDLRGG